MTSALIAVSIIALVGLGLRCLFVQEPTTCALADPVPLPLLVFVLRLDHVIALRPEAMLQHRETADRFARGQVSPAAVLAELVRTDLLCEAPNSYWLVSSALVREAARRRGVV